jgi:hypothetical protein
MPRKRKAIGVSPKKTSEQKQTVKKAREAYDRGVLSRGEAARCEKDGKLPLPYTHEIVGGKIVRRRYSLL